MLLLLLLLVVSVCTAQLELSKVSEMNFAFNDPLVWRRGRPPVPPLECAGELCPHTIRSGSCRNAGFKDDDSVDWACELTGLPQGVNIEYATIVCEPIVPGDRHYVVIGSCAIVYKLTSRLPVQHITASYRERAIQYTWLVAALCIIALGIHFSIRRWQQGQ